MAKQEKKTVEQAETTKSIGATIKSKLTQRDRNLMVKAEMIANGERPEPKVGALRTQRERNLFIKNGNSDKAKPKK